jgi:hypothetical protein
MRSAYPLRTFVLGTTALAGLTACSLTYQSLYEGDVRFEHCYRIDEEKTVPDAEKQLCWHDWSQKHTYGQSRDRIEYALARERALGQARPTGESSAPRGLVFPNGTIWAPQPTSAFIPPPQIMTRDAGGPDAERAPAVASFSERASGPLVTAPGANCGGACGKLWVQCGEQCSKANACQTGCDDRYRVCMRTCF